MKRPFLTLGLSLAVLVAALAATTQAGPPAQESRPPCPMEGIPEDLPFLEPAPAEPEALMEPAAPTTVRWSKLVFQSYRDGNWEIYRANGDGSGQVRVTNNSASDVHPRLNRGCTRIAHASNIDGDYEIVTMNLNGSGWTKLTRNDKDDVYPAWSPDGTKIAFQSYRDGQAEIYVMNADGSGQTRLTSAYGYDGQPVWSPNGTKIAFISRRTGYYYIWVMNADGSGQRSLWSRDTQENPAWSPDDLQIAFDMDGDDDGWQELWLINADGFDAHQVYKPSEPQTDAWAWSWSPDGRYVAFTRISFVYHNGYWYWTRAYLDAWDSSSGNTVRLSSQGADWRPDWQTTDSAAPITSVYALPPYLRNGRVIRWGGSDPGGSGIKTYDLQLRLGTSSWSTRWEETPATSDRFIATAGHTYYFRSRGIDNAWNVEDWPIGDGDAHTTLYSWKVTGMVKDNADIPIVDVPVATTPGAMVAFPSDGEGSYAAYVADSAHTYLAAWDKAGYGDLPPARFPDFPDAEAEAILPPADNVVLDWGFESGDLEPDWLASGVSAPEVTDRASHTGSYGAQLGCQPFGFTPPLNLSNTSDASYSTSLVTGDSGILHVAWYDYDEATGNGDVYYRQRESDGAWSVPLNISSTPERSTGPQLAVDREGNVHVVWSDYTPGNSEVFYSQRTSDGTWTSPQNISNSPEPSVAAEVAVDGNGIVHVIWQDAPDWYISDIYHAWRSGDGTWSSPQIISGGIEWSNPPRAAVDRDGIVHVVWGAADGSEIYYVRRASDGTWSAPLNLSNTPGSSQTPQLAVDGEGNVHVVWDESMGVGSGGISYARRDSSGTWSTPQSISSNPTYADRPQLAVDGGGNVHVIWIYGHLAIFYSRRGGNGFWSPPLEISSSLDSSRYPQIAVDGEGEVHVVWTGKASGNDDIYYALRSVEGTWHAPWNVSQNSGSSAEAKVATDEREGVHIVWTDDTPGNYDVYYAGPEFSTQTGHAAISQAVNVPTSMYAPTLSFLYRLGGASPTNDTWFRAYLEDGVETTTLLSTTTNSTTWVHPWFDLTPWAGQTITLTFDVHQTAERECPGVYLDEVTLGSAHPDLWISKPRLAVLPGEEVAFAITYGNRGGAAASGVQVTDQLPPELSFVAANPPPIATTPSLVWDVGGLPARSERSTIIVTATVSQTVPLFSRLTNTVTIETTSPELEVANNSAQAVVFIGRLTYLPIIWKTGR